MILSPQLIIFCHNLHVKENDVCTSYCLLQHILETISSTITSECFLTALTTSASLCSASFWCLTISCSSLLDSLYVYNIQCQNGIYDSIPATLNRNTNTHTFASSYFSKKSPNDAFAFCIVKNMQKSNCVCYLKIHAWYTISRGITFTG